MRRGKFLVAVTSVLLMLGMLLGCAQAPAAAPTQPPAPAPPTTAAKPAAQPTTAAQPAAQPTTAAPSTAPAQPAAQTTAALTGQTLTIGVFAELSGPVAASGKDMVDGARLYLEQKNNVLAGHPVKLLVEDTAADPATGIAKARKMVEQNQADILFGPLMANVGYAVGQYATDNKVTLVIPVAASNDLTQRQASPYVLRTSWAASQPMYPLAEYAYNKLGYRKVASLSADYAMGYETVGAFQRRFQDLGGKVVKKIWFPLNVADFGPFLAQIPSDIDALYELTAGPAAVGFLPAYRDYGLKKPLFSIGTGTDESILPALGDPALGIVTALPYSPVLQTPENLAFQKAFQAKYGRVATYYAEHSYAGMMAIEATLKAAGADYKEPLKFAQAFRTIKIVAPRGPIQIDEYNNAVGNIYIRKVEKVNGQLQNTVVETYPNVSQFGPYNPKEYLAGPAYTRDYPPITP